MSSISFSWNNLRKKNSPQTTAQAETTQGENATSEQIQKFGQHDLELEWLSMCNRMPQQLSGVASRMKNMSPTITEFPAIEVTVENQLAREQIENIKGKILSTLKLHLQNNDITLSIRIAEHQEQEKTLSRREQFELMEKENPSVKKLRELLNLQLA